MFDRLSDDLRKEFRDAIQNKGLAPYLTAKRRPGWEQGGNNWNQVCHAGMVGGGTPAGIGATRKPPRFLKPGELLASDIEGIGTLRNRCIAGT